MGPVSPTGRLQAWSGAEPLQQPPGSHGASVVTVTLWTLDGQSPSHWTDSDSSAAASWFINQPDGSEPEGPRPGGHTSMARAPQVGIKPTSPPTAPTRRCRLSLCQLSHRSYTLSMQFNLLTSSGVPFVHRLNRTVRSAWLCLEYTHTHTHTHKMR